MKELSLHVLDLIENSVAAGATRVDIRIHEDHARDRLTLSVADNGRGMSPALALALTDPFVTTRTTRKVGLGVPLLAAAAEQTGGGLKVKTAPGKGATITADFQLSHLDRAPLGRIEDTIIAAALVHPQLHLTFTHRVGRKSYRVSFLPEKEPLCSVVLLDTSREHIRQGRTRIGSLA